MPIITKDIIDTVNIQSIFEDPRDYLLDENTAITNALDFKCPEINIKIQNIKINKRGLGFGEMDGYQ